MFCTLVAQTAKCHPHYDRLSIPTGKIRCAIKGGRGLPKRVRVTRNEKKHKEERKQSNEKMGIRWEERVKERRRVGVVGGSIKKSHAFVIFISIFRFVSFFPSEEHS